MYWEKSLQFQSLFIYKQHEEEGHEDYEMGLIW